MDNIIVSFCIATYKRYKILEELVLEILSVDSNEFEVIVCDNCSQNIYESLECGKGKYLFYVNDRDNVDSFKIKKLIKILKELEKKEVAFAKCVYDINEKSEYKIIEYGEEALSEFACKVSHPTGYIFYKEIWKKIQNRKRIFEKECFGDYPITIICGIMALKYRGAIISGDICDVRRERLDFSKVKSRFYEGRKSKDVWYSLGVQWREWKIANYFFNKIDINGEALDQLLYLRYKECLQRLTIEYEEIISYDANTKHYDLRIPSNFVSIHMTAILNGLWFRNQDIRGKSFET